MLFRISQQQACYMINLFLVGIDPTQADINGPLIAFFVCRDLAARNVLLMEDMTAKV